MDWEEAKYKIRKMGSMDVLSGDIERLIQAGDKELGKDSCAVCFNDGRNQALEEAAKVAENNQCEADGYHACLHNEFIAKEIRALKEEG